jgi:uncharacterized coiled-coil protein SlyX
MIPREVEAAIKSLEQSFMRWPGERRYRDECDARAALLAAIERAIEAALEQRGPAGEFVTRQKYAADMMLCGEQASSAENELDLLKCAYKELLTSWAEIKQLRDNATNRAEAAEAERDRLAEKVEELTDKFDNAHQAACETHHDWRSRCYAITAAMGLDFGDPNEELPDEMRRADRLAAALAEAQARIEVMRAALKAMVDRWEPDVIGTDRQMWEDACAALNHEGNPADEFPDQWIPKGPPR